MYKNIIFLVLLLSAVPSYGQMRLMKAELPVLHPGNVTAVTVVQPDTTNKFTVGVGRNWPFRLQDTTGVKLNQEMELLFSCDVMRNNLIWKAFQYIGVLYRYGQSSEKGFDCSGYVLFIYKVFGLVLPHSSVDQYHMSRRLTADQAQPGDLVFFRTIGNTVSHVGIYIGNNMFIHSPSRGHRVTTESLDLPYYKKRFAGFGSVL
jgi:NlpC/P60 family